MFYFGLDTDRHMIVRSIFKSIKHNELYPVSSTQFICRIATMTKAGKWIVFNIVNQLVNR